MIQADLGTRVFYTQIGGFDDHAAEKNQHDRLVAEVGDGLAAFYDDLRQMGVLDRVLILTFTEFGRRVRENASAGTDHGPPNRSSCSAARSRAASTAPTPACPTSTTAT